MIEEVLNQGGGEPYVGYNMSLFMHFEKFWENHTALHP